MRFLIFLLTTLACHEIVTAKLRTEIFLTKDGKINGIHEYVIRNKRDINISKNSDSLDVKAIKYILNGENRKLIVFGGINGLKEKSYDNVEGGLGFADRNGDNLNIFAQHDITGNKLTGKGNVNIFKTDKQVMKADGFLVKDFDSKTGHDGSKYGGTLDYIIKNKFEGILAAEHDSNFGDKLSAGAKYNILNTGNQDLSARGFWGRSIPFGRSSLDTYGGSVDYLNRNNGNSATLIAEHIPNIGHDISASGRFNIFQNDNHNLAVSLGAGRHFVSDPAFDSYNTYAGNVNYKYKDLGVNLGISRIKGMNKPTFGITFQKDF